MEKVFIIIDKGFEAPRSNETKWEALFDLEIGDSFILPVISYQVPQNVLRGIRQFGVRHKIKFRHRKLDDGNYRV